MSRTRVALAVLSVFAVLVGWIVLLDRPPADDIARDAAVLLAAWADAERRADVDHARTALASSGYRRRTSALVMRTGWMRAEDEYGALVSLDLRADPAPVLDPDGDRVLRAPVRWRGERGEALTTFDLVVEDGTLRVHRTWAWPEHAPAYERVW